MRTLILYISFIASTSYLFGQATIYMSSTDCSTWNCSPCDGTVTVWLEGATLPGTYSFVITDSLGYTDTLTVVNDTIVTFTDLCQGVYYGDSFWPAQGNPGAPATPIFCTNCTPTGGGGGSGGGGNGASAAVGAPNPNLGAQLWGDVTECMCNYFGGWGDNVQLSIWGDAPPFMMSIDGGATWTSVTSGQGFYVDCWGGGLPLSSVLIMDATGQIVTASNQVTGGCVGCVEVDQPQNLTVCSGDNIAEIIFSTTNSWTGNPANIFSNDPNYANNFYWTSYNPAIGLPTNGDFGSVPAYTAPVVISPTTGTIDVYYIDPWAVCSQGWPTTFSITILPLDQINGGPDVTICAGDPVTLSATSSTPFAWDQGVQDGIPFYPSAGGTYTVTTSGTCPVSDQVDVIILPGESIDAGMDVTICEGESVTLNAISSTTFMWDNGVIDGIPFSPSQTTTYTVTTTGGGCVGTDQVTVTVNLLPSVNAGPDQSVCDGQQITLIGTGAQTYTWDNGVLNGVPFTQGGVGTMTYTVIGSDGNGCVNADSVDVIVNPNTQIDAGVDQTVCENNQVTLNASGGTSYVWDNGVTDGVAFTPPLGSTSYSVYDNTGCSDTDVVVISVLPLPAVNAGTDQILCNDGTLITLSGTGANSYIWDNGVTDGLAFSQSPGVVTYTVTGTDTSGCSNTDQVNVTVNPLPSVNAGPDQTLCDDGTQVILSGSGANSYLWNNGVIDNVPFSQATGTISYIVTGTDNNGCMDSDTVDVTVNPLPVVNAGPDQQVCEGIAVTLTGSGADTYSWDNGIVDGVAFVPVIGAVTYTVTGTDLNGCLNTDQVNILVTPAPSISAGPDQILCDNIPITLSASGTGTITWNNGIQNGVPFNQNVGIVTYTATAVDSIGCTNSDSVIVEVEDAPEVYFTASDTIGCAPLTVQFNNNSVTTSSITDCIWTINGQQIQDCGPLSYTFYESGQYNIGLSVTSLTGCVSASTYQNYISIEDGPIAAFTASENELLLWDTEVQFTNNSINAINYVWDFGDGSGSTEVNPNHIYSEEEAQSYYVELVAFTQFGCTDTARLIIQVKEDLIYYVPNTFTPDNDIYNQTFQPVFTSGFDPYDYQLLIFDRWGEIIFESHDSSIGWDGTYGNSANPRKCQDGSYTWKLEFKTLESDERKIAVGHVNLIR